jgi:hypothetical protein
VYISVLDWIGQSHYISQGEFFMYLMRWDDTDFSDMDVCSFFYKKLEVFFHRNINLKCFTGTEDDRVYYTPVVGLFLWHK